MHKNHVLIATAASLLFFSSCKHEPEFIQVTNSIPTTSGTCNTDTIYYQQSIQPLFNASCAFSGCHDAISQKEGINLSDYASIMNSGVVKKGNSASSSNLYEVITENDPDDVMPPPPYAQLSETQISTLLKWMQQGAKNNACNSICDTSNTSFSSSIAVIIQNNCGSCHSGTNPNGNLSLTNYSQIAAAANSGKLVGALNNNGYPQMPPSGPLSQCDISKIEQWVAQGAQNN